MASKEIVLYYFYIVESSKLKEWAADHLVLVVRNADFVYEGPDCNQRNMWCLFVAFVEFLVDAVADVA